MSAAVTIPVLGPGVDRYGRLHIRVNVSAAVTIPMLGPGLDRCGRLHIRGNANAAVTIPELGPGPTATDAPASGAT